MIYCPCIFIVYENKKALPGYYIKLALFNILEGLFLLIKIYFKCFYVSYIAFYLFFRLVFINSVIRFI